MLCFHLDLPPKHNPQIIFIYKVSENKKKLKMNHLCILAEFCVGRRSVTYSGHLGNLTWHQSSGHKRPLSELKDDGDIQHNFS